MAKEEKKDDKKDGKKDEGKKSPLARAVTLVGYALGLLALLFAFGAGLIWGPMTWAQAAGYDRGEKMSAVTAGEDITRAAMKPAQDFLHLGDRVSDKRSSISLSEDELLAELSKPLDSGPLNAVQQRRKKDREAQAAAKARAAGKKPAAKK